MTIELLDLRCDGHLLGHGPHASPSLTGHGPRNHGGLFAACDESWGAFTQPALGLPTDGLDDFWLFFAA